jgi:hypothetical protein
MAELPKFCCGTCRFGEVYSQEHLEKFKLIRCQYGPLPPWATQREILFSGVEINCPCWRAKEPTDG